VSVHRAYVGIGTNLGNRLDNVERAVAALERNGKVTMRSSLYRTAPWGNRDQPWFLNAVVLLETEMAPHALLEQLQAIESELGRTHGTRWGPRIIDLDLLVYDDLEIAMPGLQVPHPRLRERAFVLVPLAEIDERFAALRDALGVPELAGVARVGRESVAIMPEDGSRSTASRVRALARFLTESDAVRVRIQRGDEDIEIVVDPRRVRPAVRAEDRKPAAVSAQRVDTIKADLVGIFHVGRPTPVEGEVVDGDRELGYIEALGTRTPVHSMGGGRLVSVSVADGSAVEYGQPLFIVARTR
jgi:2-amino-4-hydroxy-6-hydroxymethyldihydropteridine diphosphokinase